MLINQNALKIDYLFNMKLLLHKNALFILLVNPEN